MFEKPSENFFNFIKQGKLIKKPFKMPSPGPYYPCLLSMDGVDNFPFEYALYFSTDHHHGRGGIWLYLCNGLPTESKNWISYNNAVKNGDFDYLKKKPKKNPIFVDKKRGRHHTETPHLNIIDGSVYMTYHKGLFGLQSTLLATSEDGINFSKTQEVKNGIILDPKKHGGHTGYFRWALNPFHRVDYKFIGYSLRGGGNNYHSALWGSDDAIHWDELHVFTPKEGFAMPNDMIMIWHEIYPNAVEQIGEDEYVMVTSGGNRASGNAKRTVEIYEVFLAGDGRTITRECRKILPNGPKGSLDDEEVSEPTMVKIGNKWHMIYVGTTKKAKKNTLMSAVGTFNPNAKPSKSL